MSINVTCAKCGKAVKAPDSAAGRKGKCPDCGAIVEIPATPGEAPKAKPAKPAPAPAEAPPEPVAADDAFGDDEPIYDSSVEALASAIDAAAGPPPPSPEDAISALAGTAPPAAPSKPAPVAPVPLVDDTPPPVAQAPAAEAQSESDEMIAVPPVGVQTPSGLPAPAHGHAMAFRWQRRLASYVRVAGLALGGLILAVGMVAMVLMATEGAGLLLPGIGIFVATLVIGAMMALGGLLGRHVLILLADLGEDVRSQESLLDRIIERLD